MRVIRLIHDRLFDPFRQADWLLPTLSRLVFAGVLLMYFWVAGLTKLEGGPFTLSFGGYAQIFPKAMEAASYDISQLAAWQHAVVYAGTYAEFVLPGLVVLGLFTRLAALGMIVFIAVQSLTDLFAHGAMSDPKVLGAWFDKAPDSLILDQRALWVMLLLILVIKGAGPLSFDRALKARAV